MLLDIEMPGEDGYSLIRKVRKLPDTGDAKMPAIALPKRCCPILRTAVCR